MVSVSEIERSGRQLYGQSMVNIEPYNEQGYGPEMKYEPLIGLSKWRINLQANQQQPLAISAKSWS